MSRATDILICTFRRPHLAETLRSLFALDPVPGPLRIIVADNDETPSAEALVAGMAEGAPMKVVYCHAPARNISIARNACLDHAEADWIALIDDDEIARPDWLARLHARAEATGADAIFGPALADYGPDAPGWMVEQDHHSNIPKRRGGEVQTGHTCNALMRWQGTPWAAERFDLARGKSGGEDTEFYFRLRRLGARFEIAEDAVVTEDVAPDRMRPEWLSARKFRMGQSYASSAVGVPAQAALLASASAKAVYCRLRAAAASDEGGRMFWRLRSDLHRGVCSGVLGRRQAALYGRDA